MGDFKDLDVWRKAHALVINTHRAIGRIRGRDLGSIRSQLIRSVISIAANLVEGSRKRSKRDFARFVNYSIDSAVEAEYHLIVAHDTGSLPGSEFRSLTAQLIEIRRMLYGLREWLQGEDGGGGATRELK